MCVTMSSASLPRFGRFASLVLRSVWPRWGPLHSPMWIARARLSGDTCSAAPEPNMNSSLRQQCPPTVVHLGVLIGHQSLEHLPAVVVSPFRVVRYLRGPLLFLSHLGICAVVGPPPCSTMRWLRKGSRRSWSGRRVGRRASDGVIAIASSSPTLRLAKGGDSPARGGGVRISCMYHLTPNNEEIPHEVVNQWSSVFKLAFTPCVFRAATSGARAVKKTKAKMNCDMYI